jgi:hypothetical protein
MPTVAKTKKKPSPTEKEASGDGDGFDTILTVGVGESTSLNMKRKSPMMATTKSKIAGSKKKTSNAAASTSEEPPSPKSDGSKCPPEQLVALEKEKGKVTTLWQRGKPVVVSDVPTGKDTGPPPKENGVSFCKQCNAQCLHPSSAPRKLCCDIETHVSLNNIGEYVVFPADTIHQGFFSAVNKIVVQMQLFCGYSNSAELPKVNHSATLKIEIQTGTMTVSSELSSSVLMNWGCDCPINKFKPPKDYKLEVVDTDENQVVERDQLKDCKYLS